MTNAVFATFAPLDPDYKLKSAAQTPAPLHHAGSNSHPNEQQQQHQLLHHQQHQQLQHPEMMMMASGAGGGGGGGSGGRTSASVADERNAYMNTVCSIAQR